MFDSHCHLDAEEYDPDRAEVLGRARSAGLVGVMVPGFVPSEWHGLAKLCALDPMLCCAVGLHPWHVHTLSERERAAALQTLPDVIAAQGAIGVGECGLDAPKAKGDGATMEVQRAVLRRHLEVACDLELPLILHCVRAHGALLEELEHFGTMLVGGVMHSYGGPRDLIGRYAKLGMSFSFASVVAREAAKKNRASLVAVPLDRLLVESDGPDQPFERGVRTEPCDIVRVLDVAAGLRTESRPELARAVTENARALFRLA